VLLCTHGYGTYESLPIVRAFRNSHFSVEGVTYDTILVAHGYSRKAAFDVVAVAVDCLLRQFHIACSSWLLIRERSCGRKESVKLKARRLLVFAATMMFNPHKLGIHKILSKIPLNAIFDAPYKRRLRKAVNIADLRIIGKARAHKVR
jgi:hypothetical protein